MEVYTDFPERYLPGVTVFIGEKNEAAVISSCRTHKDGLLIRFTGCDTPEAAGIFRNQLVFVRADDRPALEEGEYYQHQLLGLKVYDQEERSIGVVAEILETGASDVLVVRGETGEESMIPYVDEFVLEVNLAEGMMRVHLLPGMTTKQ
jgi:16S rRNA processing protein RimM